MQRKNKNILTSTDKLSAFQKKIAIWKINYINGNFEMFPSVSKTHLKEMMPIIVNHLTTLEKKLKFYFPSLNVDHYDWIRNPFIEIPTDLLLLLSAFPFSQGWPQRIIILHIFLLQHPSPSHQLPHIFFHYI